MTIRKLSDNRLVRMAIDVATVLLIAAASWRAYPAVSSEWIAHQTRDLESFGGEPTLLLVFQRDDCSSYASFLRDWGHLAETNSLRILAVPLNAAQHDSGESLARDFGIKFTIRPDLAKAAISTLRRLGHLQTPAAMLLGSDGRPRVLLTADEAESIDKKIRVVDTYLEASQ